MTTAEKVRVLINKSGLSQKAFAESVGIHPITICNGLNNDTFSMKSLKKISDKVGVSVDSLLPDSEPQEEKKPTPFINGYIEYDGKIEAIRSVEDLERIWNQVSKTDNGVSDSVSKRPGKEPTKAKVSSEAKQQKEIQAEEERPKYDIRCSDEGYAYFYMNVPLSNWWDSVPAIEYDGHIFNASESIFMYLKAKYFKDEETAAKIVEADNKTYDKPKQRWDAVKKLGRKVKNFNVKEWAGAEQKKAMATALRRKVLYDEEFKKVLLDPQYTGMTFCEASKYDQIWGIGIDAKTAMQVGRAGWKGHNLLGRALTDLRDELQRGTINT